MKATKMLISNKSCSRVPVRIADTTTPRVWRYTTGRDGREQRAADVCPVQNCLYQYWAIRYKNSSNVEPEDYIDYKLRLTGQSCIPWALLTFPMPHSKLGKLLQKPGNLA